MSSDRGTPKLENLVDLILSLDNLLPDAFKLVKVNLVVTFNYNYTPSGDRGVQAVADGFTVGWVRAYDLDTICRSLNQGKTVLGRVMDITEKTRNGKLFLDIMTEIWDED